MIGLLKTWLLEDEGRMVAVVVVEGDTDDHRLAEATEIAEIGETGMFLKLLNCCFQELNTIGCNNTTFIF